VLRKDTAEKEQISEMRKFHSKVLRKRVKFPDDLDHESVKIFRRKIVLN